MIENNIDYNHIFNEIKSTGMGKSTVILPDTYIKKLPKVDDKMTNGYALMLICSAISMYITMYFNTYEFSHVFFSWTRMYITFIGIEGMAIIMFLFMRKMY